MKKMINGKAYTISKAIGIIALLVVMFSGVAAADQIINVNGAYFKTITLPSQISPNTNFDISVTTVPFGYSPGFYYFYIIVMDGSNTIGLSSPITSTTTSINCAGLTAGNHNLYLGLTLREYDQWHNPLDYLEDSYITPSITVSNSASVPEFPSIALPVATILGLIFIIGRKKNIV